MAKTKKSALLLVNHLSFLLHRFRSAILLSLRVEFPNRRSYNENMLHLIWYLFVGFLVGCVAKALMHTHLSIMWTVVLGIVGSIIGGAVTHLFYPPSAGGKFHLGGSRFVHLAQVQIAIASRIE
jgi:uncharacterized membrane protein YeaQ/YmgE (transglycosylase-associated protein family)